MSGHSGDIPPQAVHALLMRSRRRAVALRRRRRAAVAAPAAASLAAVIAVATVWAPSDVGEDSLRVAAGPSSAPRARAADADASAPPATSAPRAPATNADGAATSAQARTWPQTAVTASAPAPLPRSAPRSASGQRVRPQSSPRQEADRAIPRPSSEPPAKLTLVERYDGPGPTGGLQQPNEDGRAAMFCGPQRSQGCVGHARPTKVDALDVTITDQGPFFVPPTVKGEIYQIDRQGRHVASHTFCGRSGDVPLDPRAVHVGVLIYADGCQGPATRGEVRFEYQY